MQESGAKRGSGEQHTAHNGSSGPEAMPIGHSTHQTVEDPRYVACNLPKRVLDAPDFLGYERVYHTSCTFGPAATTDIDDSINAPGRFSGCLLFRDKEAADALQESHVGVLQVAVVSCPLPASLSDEGGQGASPRVRVPPSSRYLVKSLVRLIFRNCDQLVALPEKLAELTSLQTLVADGCRHLKKFSSGGLQSGSLRCLFLRSCPQLRAALEISRQQLPELELCVMRYCSALPVTIDEEHEKLHELVVASVSVLKNCGAPGEQAAVDSESRGGGRDSKESARPLRLPAVLKRFSYEHSNTPRPVFAGRTMTSNTESMAADPGQAPGGQERAKLTALSFFKHRPLQELPTDSFSVESLQELDIVGCAGLNQRKFCFEVLKDLRKLTVLLASLNLEKIEKDGFLPPCEHLPPELRPLKWLTLHDMQDESGRAETIPDYVFQKLAALEVLHIAHCPRLDVVPPGAYQLTKLQELSVQHCRRLSEIYPSVENLRGLTSLDLEACSSLGALPIAIGRLKALKRLCLRDCSALAYVPRSVGRLTGLTSLVLAGCPLLESLPPDICALELERMEDVHNLQSGATALAPQDTSVLRHSSATQTEAQPVPSAKSKDNTELPLYSPGQASGCDMQCLSPCLSPLSDAFRNIAKALANVCMVPWQKSAALNVRVQDRMRKGFKRLTQLTFGGNSKRLRQYEGRDAVRLRAQLHVTACIGLLFGLLPATMAGAVAGFVFWVTAYGLAREQNSIALWVGLGAAAGLVASLVPGTLIAIWRAGRGGVGRRCLIDASGSGLPQNPEQEDGFAAEWELADLMTALEDRHEQQVLERLLRDREGRRAALEKLSVIAAFLATAALVSFDLSPSTLDDFERLLPNEEAATSPGAVGMAPFPNGIPSPAPDIAEDEAKHTLYWLGIFYGGQQASFVLSMTTILYVMVTGIPANQPADPLVTAGAIWVQYAFACFLLFSTLLLSILAFFAGGKAVYPDAVLDTEDQVVVKIACWLMVWIAYLWCMAVYRIYPGGRALWAYILFLWKTHVWLREAPVTRMPPRGGDEVLEEVLQALNALLGRVQPVQAAAHDGQGLALRKKDSMPREPQAPSREASDLLHRVGVPTPGVLGGDPGQLPRPGLKGLPNLGSTCYMNSALQCLAHSMPLLQLLLPSKFEDPRNQGPQHSAAEGQAHGCSRVLTMFSRLTQALWASDGAACVPEYVVAAFREAFIQHDDSHREYDIREQHDAPLFLQKLLPALQDGEASRLDGSGSPITYIFQGSLWETLRCAHDNCDTVSNSPRQGQYTFWCLEVPLQATGCHDVPAPGGLALEELIQAYFSEDCVDRRCSNPACTSKKGKKRFFIQHLPEVLIIHLLRFINVDVSSAGSQEQPINQHAASTKIENEVTFPLEGLNMGSFLAPDVRQNAVYDCIAVSNHDGTLSSGHYTAYCRHEPALAAGAHSSSAWHHFNDETVKPIADSDVVTPGAYVLFYQRRPCIKTDPDGSKRPAAGAPAPEPMAVKVADTDAIAAPLPRGSGSSTRL